MAGVGPTNAEEIAMLDWSLDRTGRYLGLLTTLPTDDAGAGAVEATGTGYARISIASTDWEAAIAGAPSTKSGPKSGVSWTFGTVGANWGNIKGFGLWDASTSGALRWVGTLPTPKDVLSGDPSPVFNSTHQIVAQLGDPSDTF
jgi:hypothetical protein